MRQTTLLIVIFTILVIFQSAQALSPGLQTAQALRPGIQTSISAGAVTNLTKKILPFVFQQIKALSIPDVRNGHHNILNIHINDIGLENFNLSTHTDRLVLDITSFHTSASLKYRYKTKLLSYSCNVTATIARSNIYFEIRVINNNGALSVSFQNIKFNAGTASIKLSGNLLAKLLNFVKSFFNGTIRHAIVKTVSHTLQTSLTTVAKNILSNIKLRTPLAAWGSLDLSLTGISYLNNAITVGFSGDIQNVQYTPSTTPRHSLAIPQGHSMFALGIDTFVFNSAFETYFKSAKFTRTLNQSSHGTMPANVPFNSNGWSSHIPALPTKYPNQALSFAFTLTKAPVYTISSGTNTVTLNSRVAIQVGGVTIASFDVVSAPSATVALTPNNKSYSIVPQLQSTDSQFSVASTIIGPIDMSLAQGILNIIANGVVVPIFNTLLSPGIPLSPVLIPHLILKNPNLIFPDNAIVISFGLDFAYP